MRTAVEWVALGILVLALLIMDYFHLAQAHYNTFLLLFLAFVTGLVLFFKIWHREPASDESDQGSIR